MPLIDSHAHLTFPELQEDLESVLARSRDAGVTGWITVGTDTDNNLKAISLANKYDDIWATVGFHPHYAKDVSAENLDVMATQVKDSKVVAVGEIGLDYHYNHSSIQDQHRIFKAQLDIAVKSNKAVIVHSREAFDDTIEILDEYKDKLSHIVIHCFSGNPEQAKLVIDKGYYISFTGVVTFKNAQIARDAAAVVPLNRLMVETDCPYMSPAPMRKQKINEPSLMIHTAQKLAQIHNVSLDEFSDIVEKTTREFFSI